MTPEEAIKTIRGAWSLMCQTNIRFDFIIDYREAAEIAITAIKEIQQYREIGTVEECRELESIVTKAERNELGKVIDEWLRYSKIGTVEECQEAREKQKPKKIEYESGSLFCNGFSHYRIGKCPICDNRYNSNDEIAYCSKCGQKLDWSEEDERD